MMGTGRTKNTKKRILNRIAAAVLLCLTLALAAGPAVTAGPAYAQAAQPGMPADMQPGMAADPQPSVPANGAPSFQVAQAAIPVVPRNNRGTRRSTQDAQETVPPAQETEDPSDSGLRHVHDGAQLLSPEDQKKLEELAAACHSETGVDVVVVTAYNDGRHSAMEYADDFYDYGGFGEGKEADGALFLIYMDQPGSAHGDYWISTSGIMIRILTDKRIETMGRNAADYLRMQDYAGAAQQFISDVSYYVDKGIQAGQYNYDSETGKISVYRSIRWYEALFAVAVSAGVAITACAGVVSQYKMKPSRRQKENGLLAYRAGAHFQMNQVQDILVNQFVTQTRISNSSGRSGGGGSSGRSTTHHSSSGRSHGGGGGRF